MEFRLDYPDEVDPDPLGDLMLNYLIDLDSEEDFLDFKETLDISKGSSFPKIAKDIFALANRGGGWIIIGFKQKSSEETEGKSAHNRNFLAVGLDEAYNVDQANLQQKFNAYCASPVTLRHRIFYRRIEGLERKFATIYVPPSTAILVPIRDGTYYVNDKPQVAFKGAIVLTRRGTQSVPASEEEVAWIRKRCEKQDYRQSVLSGIPDRIEEPLFSNLLPVSKIPDTVTTALLVPGALGPLSVLREGSIALPCLVQGRIVTILGDISPNTPLWNLVEQGSIRRRNLRDWTTEKGNRHLITKILNNAVVDCARAIGLASFRGKLFYPCQGMKRTKVWKTRFREKSERTVAVRMLARQLQRYVWVHSAVETRFLWLKTELVLRLTPTFVITSDGETILFGHREGTIITRLTNRIHNRGYLNSLMFWISTLSESAGGDHIELAGGTIRVESEPLESRVGVGIQSDRPVSEQKDVVAGDDEESTW